MKMKMKNSFEQDIGIRAKACKGGEADTISDYP
jgi:hypothetical protein